MIKVGKLGVLAFAALAASLLFFVPAKADSSAGLLINEIFPVPSSGGKEWVELYNPTPDVIDLTDFSLKDGSVAAKTLTGQVAAGGFFLFEVSSGWLNNTGEIVFLLDRDTGEIMDKVAYGDWETQVLISNNDTSADDNAKAPKTDQSISRMPNGTDSGFDNLDFRIVTNSPGAENKLPIFPGGIFINEILPQPSTGSDYEFVEIYNTNEVSIDISGWQIDDIEGGSSPYLLPDNTIIPGLSYLILGHTVTKISLNDSGDEVRLIDPIGDLADRVIYTPAKTDYSFAKFSDGWRWTTSTTMNYANIFTEEIIIADEPTAIVTEISIADAKRLEPGSDVSTIGVISVLPGVLSNQYFYVQDTSAGIQIYSNGADFPSLKLGDQVHITGEISSYYGEARIKTFHSSNIVVLEQAGQIVPLEIASTELGERDVGMMVATEGDVLETSGSTFIVSANPRIKVIIKESAGVNKPKMRKGYRVRVEGIVSSHNGDLRILPTVTQGVMILTSGRLPITGAESSHFPWNILVTIQKRLLQSLLPFARISSEVMWCACREIWVAEKLPQPRQLQNILVLSRR